MPAVPVGTLPQRPAPERVTAGGLATLSVLAQVLVSKYCDHIPLYRQSQIFARNGIYLVRSTRAGWVGRACWRPEALHERRPKNLLASNHLLINETPVPVLDPGCGRTKTGGLWVYTCDQWGWSCTGYGLYVRPGSQGEATRGPSGGIHGHRACAGFETLTQAGAIALVACWAHTRRKFY